MTTRKIICINGHSKPAEVPYCVTCRSRTRRRSDNCENGHPLTDDNYSKTQQCKICMRAGSKRYRDAHRKAEAKRKAAWLKNNPDAAARWYQTRKRKAKS